MFSLIKQVFVVLFIFNNSVATKCVLSNDEPCIVRATLIDLNSVKLKYYPFVITLDKCHGSCYVLSPKIYVPKKKKYIYIYIYIYIYLSI